MHERHERQLRRRAARLKLKGFSSRQIGRQLGRSRSWAAKWTRRIGQLGSGGVKSQSRQPHHSPQRYPAGVRRVVVRVRRLLEKRTVGRLIGTRAIEREIRRERLLPKRQRPSLSTIQRILEEASLIRRPHAQTAADYPALNIPAPYVWQLMDWTARYLEGGAKVYAFHSVDTETRAICQSISDNKRGDTARAHALKTWQTLGLPDFCQIDNDVDWRGSPKTPRVLSGFVRLALYVGIELIFIPEAEPECNGLIEWVNGLWARTFWSVQRFRSVAHVQRRSPVFLAWYATHYEPFPQRSQTPTEAQPLVQRRRLTVSQLRAIPAQLPISAGRLHFMRRVDAQGDVRLLYETWHVDKRLAGQYVLATIITHEHRLVIHYRRSARHAVRFIKAYRYPLSESVAPLPPEFKRSDRRRKLSTML